MLCESLKLILESNAKRLTFCCNSWVGLITNDSFEEILNVIASCANSLKKLSLGFYR